MPTTTRSSLKWNTRVLASPPLDQVASNPKKTAPGPRDRRFEIGARDAIFQGMDETKIEKLARLSGRVASKVVDALERRGYDIRGKTSAPIDRVPRRTPPK